MKTFVIKAYAVKTYVVAMVVMVFALTLFVQQAQAQEASGEIEKIQVTGSHIKRIDVEGPSPIQIIDREFLDRTGHNSVGDVLRDTNVNSFGSAREVSGSSTAGAAFVNLRGLGADRTLVLLNGRRLATDAIAGAVDLNLIPMTAVDRIEILKDGASATYGSDALGGVINIITKKDFDGSELNIQQTYVEQGGGDRSTIGALVGRTTEKGNWIGVFQYRKNTRSYMRDRDWSKTGFSDLGSPGSYVLESGAHTGLTRADDDCPSGLIRNDGAHSGGRDNTICRYNYADIASFSPEIEQYNALATITRRIGSGLSVFGDFGYTRKNINWVYAPAPGQFPGLTLSDVEATDNGETGTVLYRITELGNRDNETVTNSANFNVGMKGEMGESWEWELSGGYHRIHRFDKGVAGYALTDRVSSLFSSGAFKPFAAEGSRGSMESARWEPWQENVSERTSLNAQASGEVFNMQSGAAAMAVGMAYARELYVDKADEQNAAGNVFSNSGSAGGGDRKMASLFSELALPVTSALEVQVSGRVDNYSDAGTAFVPKIGSRWQASKRWMLRSSFGTGYKAPTLQQLYVKETQGFPWFIDSVACASIGNNDPTNTYCQPKQYLVVSPGNRDLFIEKSISANLGAVFQQAKYRSFGLDVWFTQMNNVIDIDPEAITQAEANSSIGTSGLNDYGIVVTRNSAGAISNINAPLLNLASRDVFGADFAFDDLYHLGSMKLALMFKHSQLFAFKQEGFPGLGKRDRLGESRFPAWRNNLTVKFIPTAKMNMALTMRNIAPQDKAIPSKGELDMHSEYDFQFNYDAAKWGRITFGIRNLLNTDPPLDNSNSDQPDVIEQVYDIRGREHYLAYKLGF